MKENGPITVCKDFILQFLFFKFKEYCETREKNKGDIQTFRITRQETL